MLHFAKTFDRTAPRKLLCRTYHAKSNHFGFKEEITLAKEIDSDNILQNQIENANLSRLVSKYRQYGHKKALIDPLSRLQMVADELEHNFEQRYGLSRNDSKQYDLSGILNMTKNKKATLSEIVDYLEKTYCGYLSAEFQHISDEAEIKWLTDKFEESTQTSLDLEKRKDVAKLLLKSKVFDDFLAKKFPTLKRYCGAGAESLVPFVDEVFRLASCEYGIENIVLGMAHRGKSELLACVLDYPPARIFSKIMGKPEFPMNLGTGDVLSHIAVSRDLYYDGDKPLRVSLIPNPSHLEAHNPVACGKLRSKQLTLAEGHYSNNPDSKTGDKTLCLQLHGDASFTGQGIISELFCMCNLPHYSVGGSIHLIVNNQLGFTTPPEQGRSSQYASDIAKSIGCPVFHVNGDHPEEVIRACHLAMEYRMKYRKDVVVDLLCYRRWGHNETDEPSFTQPTMYCDIESRHRVPDLYIKELTDRGIDVKDIFEDLQEYEHYLTDESKRASGLEGEATNLRQQWSGLRNASKDHITHFDTGCDLDMLLFTGAKSCEIPENITIHPHLRKTHCDSRLSKLKSNGNIDWATAEAMAVGSLLCQGHNVRLSGQDVGRGTFSHRHFMFVDQQTDEIFVPLNNMTPRQNSFLEVCNSPLSEEAVLGFEYGVSIDNPDNLVIWEAQFGDFFNGAQIIVDNFIASGESKWLFQSGLVMLLPHGMDGMGPEHSSSRIERFLQLSDSEEDKVDGDNVNIHIVNPTTPAQYFHLLRRQIVRDFRKPLIVASPKLLLRSSAAVSSLSEMIPGTCFHPVLGDPDVGKSDSVKRIIFCSGKFYYNLVKEREKKNITDTAIVRLEALTPFPAEELKTEIQQYPNSSEYIWCQEEHRNMAAWSFVKPRFEYLLGVQLQYVGRPTLAAPAVGVSSRHQQESEAILEKIF